MIRRNKKRDVSEAELDNEFEGEEGPTCHNARRLHHNNLERERRNKLKQSMHNLQEVIRNVRKKKEDNPFKKRTSNCEVLTGAVTCIKSLEKKNDKYARKLKNTDKENDIFQAHIMNLTHQFRTGVYTEESLTSIAALIEVGYGTKESPSSSDGQLEIKEEPVSEDEEMNVTDDEEVDVDDCDEATESENEEYDGDASQTDEHDTSLTEEGYEDEEASGSSVTDR